MPDDWCTSADGTRIALYDLGGSGPDLVLAHANGFCAGVLRPLAAALSSAFHCVALDLRFHGHSGRPAGEGADWSGFAEDVAAAVDHLGFDRPFGFGHSSGGAAALLAEEARPGTFAALYCFEPVVLPADEPLRAPFYENPLTAGALRRRQTFPSAADAFANFASKPPFDTFHPDALLAYVTEGFEVVPATEGGDGEEIRLRCAREDEAAIYAYGFTHRGFQGLPGVTCPVTLACGASTDAFNPTVLAKVAARLDEARVEEFAGMGHFGPMERPDEVARSVREHLVAGPTGWPRPGGRIPRP